MRSSVAHAGVVDLHVEQAKSCWNCRNWGIMQWPLHLSRKDREKISLALDFKGFCICDDAYSSLHEEVLYYASFPHSIYIPFGLTYQFSLPTVLQPFPWHICLVYFYIILYLLTSPHVLVYFITYFYLLHLYSSLLCLTRYSSFN